MKIEISTEHRPELGFWLKKCIAMEQSEKDIRAAIRWSFGP